MANFDFKQLDIKCTSAKEWLSKEYRGFRTGRAAPAILDGVVVSAYGSMMPLKQVANVGVEDARTLRVTAFDAGLLKDVERAISAANLGVGTSSDGSNVRVTFPDLTSERREQIVKLAKGKLEEARATVRVARDESWKKIQEEEREGVLTEDDKFTLKEDLQKRIDAINEELQKTFDRKEEELTA